MALTLTDRLAKQLSLYEQRKSDLNEVEASWARCEEDRAITEGHKKEAIQQREKCDKLFQEMEAQDAAIRKETADIAANNEKERNALMREMEEMVARVNARVHSETEREGQVKYRNNRLKEHIALVKDHLAQGTEKIQTLLEMREKDVHSVEEHLAREAELQAVLTEKVALQKQKIEEALVIHTELKKEADGHVAHFTTIQTNLKAARAAFDDGQTHKESLQRKLAATQAERKQTQNRADRAHKDHDTELEHVQKLEIQIAQLEAQTKKLKALTDALAEKAE